MIGKTISHYKILAKLGEGGMGVVYKAKDTKLKRTVALKFLSAIVLGGEEKNRFLREAQAAAALNHPNICTIYEIDEVEGQSFIAMEFVEGQSLKAKIEAGPLKLDEALNIVMQVAEGLQAAHEKKITHRDIKPANIMLKTKGQAKIMDFGLAKLAGRTIITKEGATLGTTAYMSPEQGRGEEVDQRTDIWALGVVLYEMITGQLPFKGLYEQAVVYSILNENPEPLTSLRTGVPMELERVVNKCLEKQAAHRYQHADDLLADLRRVQKESKPIAAFNRTNARASIPKRGARTLVLPAISLGVLIAAAIGYFLFFGQKQESVARLPIAVVDFVNETAEKELDGLSGMLITSLEKSRRLSVLTRSRMFDILKQMEKHEVDRIDETLGREICQRAQVRAMVIATIRKFGRRYAIDLKILDPQGNQHLFATDESGEGQESIPAMIDKLSEKARRGLKEQAAEIQAARQKVAEVTTTNIEAYQHYFKGEELLDKIKLAEAVEEFRKAIALDSTFGLAHYRLGYALHLMGGRNQEAKASLQTAVDLIDRIPEKEQYLARAQYAHIGHSEKEMEDGLAIVREMEKIYSHDKEMLFFIGDYSYHNRHYAASLEYLERVLTIDPQFRRALIHLILLFRDTGNYERMLAIAQRNKSLGDDADAYYFLGNAYERLNRYDEAIFNLEKALAMDRDPSYYHELGYVYYLQGNFAAAEKVLNEGLPFDSRKAMTHYLLGTVFMKQKRLDEAQSLGRKFLTENPGFHGDNLLAWVLIAGKIDLDQGMALAQRALNSKAEAVVPMTSTNYENLARTHPYFPLPEHALGSAYLQRGQFKAAMDYLEQATALAPLRQNIKNDLEKAREKVGLEK
jgi:serine/threonine protein kinase/tetratricopeptide (TPR) repeat protein